MHRSIAALVSAAIAAALLAGCTANYAVDVRNKTPQPLYAGIYQQTEIGDSTLVSNRLGPGDRALVGPARGRIGRTYLWVDTRPNPGPPVTMPLGKGTTIVEVRQTDPSNEGRLELKIVH